MSDERQDWRISLAETQATWLRALASDCRNPQVDTGHDQDARSAWDDAHLFEVIAALLDDYRYLMLGMYGPTPRTPVRAEGVFGILAEGGDGDEVSP